MGRAELGSKCTCAGCSERFYDLNKTPPVCPKCGAELEPPKPRTLRPSRGTVESRRFTKPLDPAASEDGVAHESTADADDEEEEEEDAIDADDDVSDDIAIDPDHDKSHD